jgi:uncharacterized membrane protein YhaH (DUF805 family)
MDELRRLLSPWGRTSRSHYWQIVLVAALVLLVAMIAGDQIGRPAAATVIIAVQLAGFLATIRRLNDAGWSRWWLPLYLFPLSITVDLFHFQLGLSTWNFVDVSAAIRSIPVMIGLFAPSSLHRGLRKSRARAMFQM